MGSHVYDGEGLYTRDDLVRKVEELGSELARMRRTAEAWQVDARKWLLETERLRDLLKYSDQAVIQNARMYVETLERLRIYEGPDAPVDWKPA